jgi:hypothetical protein
MKLPAPEILATPAWADVASALRKARTIDCEENDFAVGVCDDRGRVIGAALLRCYKQVSRFTREMRKLGYAAHIDPSCEAMQGCDVLYAAPKPAARRRRPAS